MKRFLGVSVGVLLIAGTASADDVNRDEAYQACSQYIEKNVAYFRGDFIPKEHRLKVVPKYNYKDLGDSHWLTWTLKSPIYLANESGIIKGIDGKTGGGCEVDKKTGEIKYLSVSNKEIIRH